MKIGLIGIVNEEVKSDRLTTYERLRTLGYEGIETEALHNHPDRRGLLADLRKAGLEIATCHTKLQLLKDELDPLADSVLEAACRYITISWGPAESIEQIKRDAAIFNECGARLKEKGITLCYHNHEHEFMNRFNSRAAMNVILGESKDLAIHFDIAWGAFGGANPVAFIERYAGRIPLVHVKDLYDLSVRNCFTAPGTGLVDVKGSIEAARKAGVEWLSIEQDSSRRLKGLDLATAAILNLRELGL